MSGVQEQDWAALVPGLDNNLGSSRYANADHGQA